jgi:hypothetical protein
MPTNLLYHTWFQRIRELRPLQRITQIRNFTWLIVGIYLSRSVHLSKVAGKIRGSAKLVSITRRVSRFLDNPEEWQLPDRRTHWPHGESVLLLPHGWQLHSGSD